MSVNVLFNAIYFFVEIEKSRGEVPVVRDAGFDGPFADGAACLEAGKVHAAAEAEAEEAPDGDEGEEDSSEMF